MNSQYKRAFNQITVSDKAVEGLLQKAEGLKSKKLFRFSCRAVVAIATVTALVITSVSAAVYYLSPFRASGEYEYGYKGRVENGNQSYVDSVGTNVNQTTKQNNVKLTIKKVVADTELIYVTFDYETIDGTPLQEKTENSISSLVNQRFKSITLTVGEYSFKNPALFRLDNASVQNKASFEATFFKNQYNLNGVEGERYSPKAEISLDGTTVTLNLTDYVDEVTTCEDLKFTYKTLGDLYRSAKAESPDNFVQIGAYHYSKGRTSPVYAIPKGSQNIAFSSKLKDCVIDNIGIHGFGEYGCVINHLYLSFTPTNSADLEKLNHIGIRNIKTGKICGSYPLSSGESNGIKYTNKEYLNNRVVLLFGVYMDGSVTQNKQRDITPADLDNYELCYNSQMKTVIRQQGSWKSEFKLTCKDTARKIVFDKAKQAKYGISEVVLDSLTIKVKGTKYFKTLNDFYMIMKDGSEVSVGPKVGGSVSPIDMDAIFEKVIDPSQVVALKICGNVIPLS